MSKMINWLLSSNEMAAISALITIGIIVYLYIFIKKKIRRVRFNKRNANIHMPSNTKPADNKIHNTFDVLPYERRPFIFTKSEYSFYKELKSVIGGDYYICPKVGIKDFIAPKKNPNYKEYMSWFSRIAQKHVDFLICDSLHMRPLVCIELDDYTHNKPKTQQRDVFVERVYKSANFPIVRFKTSYQYSTDYIRDILKPYLPFITVSNESAGVANDQGSDRKG